MKRSYWRSPFAILLVAAISLGGCVENGAGGMSTASFSSSGQKTAAERQLEAEVRSLDQVTRNIVVRNTVQGAMVGAALGCGLALAFGGRSEDCAKGALAGGVAGGVYGNQVGKRAAAVKVELVKRDRIIANLKGVNAKLNGIEANVRSVVRAQDVELRSLRRQVKAGQISKSAYEARLQAINSNRATVSNGLLKAQKNVVNTRSEIATARRKGQPGLATVDAAAASTEARLARNRKLLALAS